MCVVCHKIMNPVLLGLLLFIKILLILVITYSWLVDKSNGSGNAAFDLSTKICVSSKMKNINVKVFNMITRTNKAKTMVKHISCNCKCNFNSTIFNSN